MFILLMQNATIHHQKRVGSSFQQEIFFFSIIHIKLNLGTSLDHLTPL